MSLRMDNKENVQKEIVNEYVIQDNLLSLRRFKNTDFLEENTIFDHVQRMNTGKGTISQEDLFQLINTVSRAFPEDGLESVSLLGKLTEDFDPFSKVYDADLLVIYAKRSYIDIFSINKNLRSCSKEYSPWKGNPVLILPNLLCGPIRPAPSEEPVAQIHVLLYSTEMFQKRGRTCQYDALHTAQLLHGRPVTDILSPVNLELTDVLDDPFGLRNCREQLTRRQLHFFEWIDNDEGSPKRAFKKMPIIDAHTLFTLVTYACIRTTRNIVRLLSHDVGTEIEELNRASKIDSLHNLAQLALKLRSYKEKYERGTFTPTADQIDTLCNNVIISLDDVEEKILNM